MLNALQKIFAAKKLKSGIIFETEVVKPSTILPCYCMSFHYSIIKMKNHRAKSQLIIICSREGLIQHIVLITLLVVKGWIDS